MWQIRAHLWRRHAWTLDCTKYGYGSFDMMAADANSDPSPHFVVQCLSGVSAHREDPPRLCFWLRVAGRVGALSVCPERRATAELAGGPALPFSGNATDGTEPHWPQVSVAAQLYNTPSHTKRHGDDVQLGAGLLCPRHFAPV